MGLSELSMYPHSGVGGREPNPKKLRLEAMIMLKPTRPAEYTKIGLKMFSKSSEKMIAGALAPLNRAASMYSSTMARRVAASATRAIGAMYTMLTEMMTL